MNPHIVVSATPLWSHIRSLCVFAIKVVGERATDVTILVPFWGDTFKKVSAEVRRCLLDVPGLRPLGAVRVVALGPHSVDPAMAANVEIEPFEQVWAKLIDEQPVTCSATSVVYPAARKPSFLILDGFQYSWFPTVRRLSPEISIILWSVGFSGGIMRLMLPDSQGGQGDILRADWTEEELRSGKPIEPTGKLILYEGLPAMYDWENRPQTLPEMPGFIQSIESNFSRATSEADGFATVCPVGYESQAALDAMSKWIYSEHPNRPRPTYHLGPIIPIVQGTTEFTPASLKAEMDTAPGDAGLRVVKFLNQALDQYGTHSVVYICFGNLFWPWNNTDHLWLLLDKLADRGVPFILSHSSPMAQIPEKIATKYGGDSKIGFLSPWSPQQTILAHPATGWFVTHGGMGGTVEAMTQGVPLIAWPFLADQPVNIAHCVHTLNVAYELLEVRSAPYGLKPIYLRDGFTPSGTRDAFEKELEVVLDAVQGDDGKLKRENARKVQQRLGEAWAKGGAARRDFETMLDRFAPL